MIRPRCEASARPVRLCEDDGVSAIERKLIIDRHRKYCADFRTLLASAGCEIIRLPARPPSLNAYAERFVGSIKAECLDRLIFFGEASLHHAIGEYISHYGHERNHQAMANRLLVTAANDSAFGSDDALGRRSRLGGMLNHYHREAA